MLSLAVLTGLQAVHLAATGDHIEVLQVLQKHGCDLEAPGRDGYTPIHLAAESNCVKVARWLMDQGVSLTLKNHDLLTPEDCARRRKNLDLTEMLQQYAVRDGRRRVMKMGKRFLMLTGDGQ